MASGARMTDMMDVAQRPRVRLELGTLVCLRPWEKIPSFYDSMSVYRYEIATRVDGKWTFLSKFSGKGRGEGLCSVSVTTPVILVDYATLEDVVGEVAICLTEETYILSPKDWLYFWNGIEK